MVQQRRQGDGKYTFADGSYVEGDWVQDLVHGHAVHVVPRGGAVYEGMWREGRKHGNGEMRYANNDNYSGQWVADQRHGGGTFVTRVNGQKRTFAGSWKKDKFIFGKVTFGRVATYEGNWYYDRFDKGRLTVKRKGETTVYEGKWKRENDIQKHDYISEAAYENGFPDGKVTGKGQCAYPNGEKCIGEFVNGVPHGICTFTYKNGDVHVGRFKEGVRHGKGTLTYANGDVYTGSFRNNVRHGKGTLLRAATGEKRTCRWKDDECVGQFVAKPKPLSTTYRTLNNPLGCVWYEGRCVNCGRCFDGSYGIEDYNDDDARSQDTAGRADANRAASPTISERSGDHWSDYGDYESDERSQGSEGGHPLRLSSVQDRCDEELPERVDIQSRFAKTYGYQIKITKKIDKKYASVPVEF